MTITQEQPPRPERERARRWDPKYLAARSELALLEPLKNTDLFDLLAKHKKGHQDCFSCECHYRMAIVDRYFEGTTP